MKQTGARHIFREKQAIKDKEIVCLSTYKANHITIQLPNGVLKRPKVLKRQAE